MRLYVAATVGRASTELAAFDAALIAAGVGNFNLIRLSSVIPPACEVVRVERCPFTEQGSWGDRLYAVYAEQRTSKPGEQVWAGVGWVQDPTTGQGLFVEHEGHAEAEVHRLLEASLHDLQRNRGIDGWPVETCVTGAVCEGRPTCALVICGYAVTSWPRTAIAADHVTGQPRASEPLRHVAVAGTLEARR
jgi:arginine decarboxylase